MNHSYPLRDAPGGKVFMQLQCGPFRVVAESEGHLQLAQLRYGIELTGWLAQEELRPQAPASSGCVSRSMAARGLPRCWGGSLGWGRSISGSGGYTSGINGAGFLLHAGWHQVVLRGTGAALLSFTGDNSCECGGGIGTRGGHYGETLQVVALEKDRAVLVHGGDYTRYAPEDAAALYFSRAACEAGTEHILVRGSAF